jgi:hypothetical protein
VGIYESNIPHQLQKTKHPRRYLVLTSVKYIDYIASQNRHVSVNLPLSQNFELFIEEDRQKIATSPKKTLNKKKVLGCSAETPQNRKHRRHFKHYVRVSQNARKLIVVHHRQGFNFLLRHEVSRFFDCG